MATADRTLSIPELEAVLLVAETRNFRQAAERAHVSQPALSRRVQSAEAKLNARLFDRTRHSVALTDAGAELVPIAQRLLAEFRDSLSDLSAFIAGHRGSVAVWALPSVAAALLPATARAFQQTHPMVRLLIQSASAQQVTQAVLDGVADMGISVAGPALPAGLHFAPLLEEAFFMICQRGDALARKRRVDWSVFAQRPFIASGPASSIRLVTDQVLATTGHAPQVQVVADNISVVGAMVAEGVGIAAVPRLALRLMDRERIQGVALTAPTATRAVGILTRKGRSLSASATAFLARLKDAPKR